METQSQIIYQETPRNFRTEIPNVVFELLEAGEISSNDLTLYSTYRRIAGEHGACWVGTRGLEKRCRLKDKTITASKKNLSRPFALLGGKSLINITPCDRKKEEADTITIIDIWPENHQYFKNKLRCSKRGDGGVVNEGTRVSYLGGHKKEPYKKEPKKNIIAQPNEPPKEPDKPKQPNGNNNFSIYSSLRNCDDFSDSQKRLLMKYPEQEVDRAVKFVYHPSTKTEGGPIGRLKYMQFILKNPESFAETIDNLDNPVAKMSKKEQLLSKFVKYQTYNGYEFVSDNVGVSLCSQGQYTAYTVRHDSRNFVNEFTGILNKCGIQI